IAVQSFQLAVGLDVQLVFARAAEELGVPVRDLVDHGVFRRIRVVRSLPGTTPARTITAETLGEQDARDGAIAMGRYLARGVDESGHFRYLVDAPTNQTLPGYDWPRHGGGVYFLA